MNFSTLVELPRGEFQISHTDRLMLFGSCFAGNIGRLLVQNKFRCDVNPFGVLYNPLSILEALGRIMEGKDYTADNLFFHQGNWHSPMHHSSFSDPLPQVCLAGINRRLCDASRELPRTDYMLVTFGTASVYKQKETGAVVGNCHKLPESYFNRSLLGTDEVVSLFSRCIASLSKVNPQMKWLFTVSPIRHIKDGMHANQLSKSVLLLSIHELKTLFPEKVFYFPAYELVMDELRDYRFYADDMLHPSSLAVSYIWECFVNSYFSKETLDFMRQWGDIIKALNHKAFEPSSEKYKSFLMQNVLRINRAKEKYPYLDVEKELELCHTLLRR